MFNYLFKDRFAIAKVNDLTHVDDMLKEKGIESFNLEYVSDLLHHAKNYKTMHITRKVTPTCTNLLLKNIDDLDETVHLVLFTQTLEIPETLKQKADNIYAMGELGKLTPFRLTSKELEWIKNTEVDLNDYRFKADVLINYLTSIHIGNIIKLIKEVDGVIFLKILAENDLPLIDYVYIKKAIEDINYYRIDKNLVLTTFLENMQRRHQKNE